MSATLTKPSVFVICEILVALILESFISSLLKELWLLVVSEELVCTLVDAIAITASSSINFNSSFSIFFIFLMLGNLGKLLKFGFGKAFMQPFRSILFSLAFE